MSASSCRAYTYRTLSKGQVFCGSERPRQGRPLLLNNQGAPGVFVNEDVKRAGRVGHIFFGRCAKARGQPRAVNADRPLTRQRGVRKVPEGLQIAGERAAQIVALLSRHGARHRCLVVGLGVRAGGGYTEEERSHNKSRPDKNTGHADIMTHL